MEARAKNGVAFSATPVVVLAALSVVALVGVSVTQAWKLLHKTPVSAVNVTESAPIESSTLWSGVDWQFSLTGITNPEDPDGLLNIEDNVASALLGTYSELVNAGAYTPEMGERIAEDIASTLRARISYTTYDASSVKTDPDTSYERMLRYRADMRTALEPLMENPGYELSLFASYVESRDVAYTEKLAATADNYRVAVANAMRISVPADAVQYHVAAVNALSEFGAVVEAFAVHADDAFAAAALLQTYNASEQKLVTSFDALASYQKKKTL